MRVHYKTSDDTKQSRVSVAMVKSGAGQLIKPPDP